ncbi:MAG: SDR family NAD(P)-dependent oxidoreductase [Acidimicrobiales bacterium]|nr:SDR family NAD(P)-dependent oxidoreductase [Acidimicrobiales bacterium]
MTGSRVLVLGGAGAVGRHTSRQLIRLGHRVVITGRTPAPLHHLAQQHNEIDVVAADANDHKTLRGAGSVDAVVNTTGLVDRTIVQPWLDEGTPFVDIAASGEEIRQLERCDASRSTLLLSVGLLPGLSTLIAADLAARDPDTSPITIGALLGVGEDYGDASRRWTIGRLGARIDGHDGPFRNFTTPVPIDFPGGFGARNAYRFDFADHYVLSRDLDVPVTTAYCMDSRLANTALTLAARIPGAPRALLAANRASRRAAKGSDWWAATIFTDNHTTWALGRAQSESTGVLTAIATDRLLTTAAQPGVRHIHQLLELDDIRDHLPNLGIAMAQSPGEGH